MSTGFRSVLTGLAVIVAASTVTGCGLDSQTHGQHGGTTVMLVGLSTTEMAEQHASTLECARKTIAWAAQEGAELVMAPVGLPSHEQWPLVDFALRTSAQRSNPFAAKRWRVKQSTAAEQDLRWLQTRPPGPESSDLLAAATDGSRVLNYRHGPRTLVLCAAAIQRAAELTIGPTPTSAQAIQVALYRLRDELEPMRLTRVVFGAAGDSEEPGQSLVEQASQEMFWRAWAHHEGAIHFSYGPIPHYPYS